MVGSSGNKKPTSTIRVLVHAGPGSSSWSLGELKEWRWVDEATGAWEGLVTDGTKPKPEWIPGDRLKRVRD